MAENENQSKEYRSIDIVQKDNLEEVLEPGTDCCIYRVPQHIRKINKEAYSPRLISIGPLHYGREELMGMENQKKRFWSIFWERVNNAEKSEEFKTYIENQEQRIRDHYSVSSTLQSSEYVAMIQRDVVFIIELFMRNYKKTNDFLIKSPSLHVSIITDLLLLENQVPYFVLDHLYTETFPNIDVDDLFSFLYKYPTTKGDALFSFLYDYFSPETFPNSERNPSFFHLSLFFFAGVMKFNRFLLLVAEPQVQHFTDLVRHAFVMEVQPAESHRGMIYDLPAATKLNKSGLNFSFIEDKCYLDITLEKRRRGKWLPWFEVNELQIPRIEIYDETEGLFRNMMALEMFHYPTQTHICNYVDLLDYLIDTVNDVDLLVEKGIIVNCVGDNKVIAKMFNKLGTYMTTSTHSRYCGIVDRMKTHYNNPWNHAKATLRSGYFSNVWTGIATVAATFLLILTVIQTVCSIMQVI
ncbi:hypothetical protein EZV62_009547 [Acer yangbiense]|uniref:Uncharacterized protein n=1 Tax=Acer yangbiense TaxID=1000413 RepID=A0A5C7HZC6_9ROSI|nr:hypothetical protein EZV62_009547 [Acer yangbiense]